MIISAALVFFMTPGLAFFYGGLVRRKNVVNTMMACVAIMGVAIVMWCLFGYSLAFGGNHGGVIGDFRWFGLNGVDMEAGPYADNLPAMYVWANEGDDLGVTITYDGDTKFYGDRIYGNNGANITVNGAAVVSDEDDTRP